jgi:hypothetical protein
MDLMFGRRQKQKAGDEQNGASGASPARSDEQIGRFMQGLADAFVRGAAEEGERVDYSAAGVYRLDGLVDLLIQNHGGQLPPDLAHSMTLSMGAFLGEAIVRSRAGAWVPGPDAEGPPAIRLTNSNLVCSPLAKVHKRLTIGPQHSITQFFDVAMTGVIPPGTPAGRLPVN